MESLLFSFAIGGVAAVFINVLTGRQAEPLPPGERQHPRHRFHLLALAAPFLVFIGCYLVFLIDLELTPPRYIERVWNLGALSGWTPFGLPIEELLFAAGFGGYWAGVYEHFTWHRPRAPSGHRPTSLPTTGATS
jgi:hypothetical protein